MPKNKFTISTNKRNEIYDRLTKLMQMIDPTVTDKIVYEKDVDEKVVKLLRIIRDRRF